MTREELLEFAALDVYGLLDEYEAALYTRSFHHAPVTVQQEIVDLQAKISADESMLPDLTPPADLRARVLENVANAIEQENAELEPIASIGYRRVTESAPRGQRPIVARLFAGSGHFWRAACFALCGAVVVLVFFWRDAKQEASDIIGLALDQQTLLILDQEFDTIESFLADPGMESVAMVSQSATLEDGAWARVFLADGKEKAFLAFNGLNATPGEVYTLTVTDADGDVREVISFDGRDRIAGMVVDLASVQIAATSAWTITSSTGVMFRST